MAFNQWDPKETNIVWTPIGQSGIEMSSFAEGTFFSDSAAEDFVSPKVGARGDVTLTISNNDIRDIEVTLMGTSSESNLLMQAFNLGRAGSGGFARGALVVTNLRLGTTLTYANCWIKRQPDMEFSAEGEDITWMFGAAGLEATLNAATL